MFLVYVRAMRFANSKYGRAHLCHLIDEWREFAENWEFSEFCDVLHTLIRMTGSTWIGYIVYPCARKFAQRFQEYGDIRSKRHLN